MKKVLSGLALSALLVAPALAADLPARMPVKAAPAVVTTMYNWSGFYIGGHGGYGWGDADWAFTTGTATSHDVDGYVAGIHTGFNWQFGHWVLGIEGSVSKTGMDGSSTCPVAAVRCETEIDHFWRAGARAVVAVGATGNWLLYGTGGFARAYVPSRTVVIATGANTAGDKTHHHGWYGGAGIEWGVSPNFTIGVEAFHVSMDAEGHFLPGGAVVAGSTRNIDLDYSVVLARATYKFNWGSAAMTRY